MHFVAIVERRLLHWYVVVPLLRSGTSMAQREDARSCATALVTAATGLAPSDVQITVHQAVPADTLLRTPSADVEIQHADGTWRAAQHVGWVRPRDGSWRPLVCYTADGVQWERAVNAARFRRPEREVVAVPGSA